MSYFLNHCRLATNYQVDLTSAQPNRLIDVYSKCHSFFQSLNVLPPSKDLISNLIPILFKVSRCITYSCGEQFIIYKRLSQRTENHNTTVLDIPGSCTATTNECQELNISCWREYIVNDEPFKVSVTFGSKETVIKVRDDSFRFSFLLPPSQGNADDMIFILERLQICRGYLSTNSESNKSLLETWYWRKIQ